LQSNQSSEHSPTISSRGVAFRAEDLIAISAYVLNAHSGDCFVAFNPSSPLAAILSLAPVEREQ
jgi:hypothetical protein